MFQVTVEIRVEGEWEQVEPAFQNPLIREDEVPFVLQAGDDYYFELPNKDLVIATVCRAAYHSYNKKIFIYTEIPAHMWDYEEFLKVGWKIE